MLINSQWEHKDRIFSEIKQAPFIFFNLNIYLMFNTSLTSHQIYSIYFYAVNEIITNKSIISK